MDEGFPRSVHSRDDHGSLDYVDTFLKERRSRLIVEADAAIYKLWCQEHEARADICDEFLNFMQQHFVPRRLLENQEAQLIVFRQTCQAQKESIANLQSQLVEQDLRIAQHMKEMKKECDGLASSNKISNVEVWKGVSNKLQSLEEAIGSLEQGIGQHSQQSCESKRGAMEMKCTLQDLTQQLERALAGQPTTRIPSSSTQDEAAFLKSEALSSALTSRQLETKVYLLENQVAQLTKMNGQWQKKANDLHQGILKTFIEMVDVGLATHPPSFRNAMSTCSLRSDIVDLLEAAVKEIPNRIRELVTAHSPKQQIQGHADTRMHVHSKARDKNPRWHQTLQDKQRELEEALAGLDTSATNNAISFNSGYESHQSDVYSHTAQKSNPAELSEAKIAPFYMKVAKDKEVEATQIAQSVLNYLQLQLKEGGTLEVSSERPTSLPMVLHSIHVEAHRVVESWSDRATTLVSKVEEARQMARICQQKLDRYEVHFQEWAAILNIDIDTISSTSRASPRLHSIQSSAPTSPYGTLTSPYGNPLGSGARGGMLMGLSSPNVSIFIDAHNRTEATLGSPSNTFTEAVTQALQRYSVLSPTAELHDAFVNSLHCLFAHYDKDSAEDPPVPNWLTAESNNVAIGGMAEVYSLLMDSLQAQQSTTESMLEVKSQLHSTQEQLQSTDSTLQGIQERLESKEEYLKQREEALDNLQTKHIALHNYMRDVTLWVSRWASDEATMLEFKEVQSKLTALEPTPKDSAAQSPQSKPEDGPHFDGQTIGPPPAPQDEGGLLLHEACSAMKDHVDALRLATKGMCASYHNISSMVHGFGQLTAFIADTFETPGQISAEQLVKQVFDRISSQSKEVTKLKRNADAHKRTVSRVTELVRIKLPALIQILDDLIGDKRATTTSTSASENLLSCMTAVNVSDWEQAWSGVEHRVGSVKHILESTRREADNERRRRKEYEDRVNSQRKRSHNWHADLNDVYDLLELLTGDLGLIGTNIDSVHHSPTKQMSHAMHDFKTALTTLNSKISSYQSAIASLQQQIVEAKDELRVQKERTSHSHRYALQVGNEVLSLLRDLKILPSLTQISSLVGGSSVRGQSPRGGGVGNKSPRLPTPSKQGKSIRDVSFNDEEVSLTNIDMLVEGLARVRHSCLRGKDTEAEVTMFQHALEKMTQTLNQISEGMLDPIAAEFGESTVFNFDKVTSLWVIREIDTLFYSIPSAEEGVINPSQQHILSKASAASIKFLDKIKATLHGFHFLKNRMEACEMYIKQMARLLDIQTLPVQMETGEDVASPLMSSEGLSFLLQKLVDEVAATRLDAVAARKDVEKARSQLKLEQQERDIWKAEQMKSHDSILQTHTHMQQELSKEKAEKQKERQAIEKEYGSLLQDVKASLNARIEILEKEKKACIEEAAKNAADNQQEISFLKKQIKQLSTQGEVHVEDLKQKSQARERLLQACKRCIADLVSAIYNVPNAKLDVSNPLDYLDNIDYVTAVQEKAIAALANVRKTAAQGAAQKQMEEAIAATIRQIYSWEGIEQDSLSPRTDTGMKGQLMALKQAVDRHEKCLRTVTQSMGDKDDTRLSPIIHDLNAILDKMKKEDAHGPNSVLHGVLQMLDSIVRTAGVDSFVHKKETVPTDERVATLIEMRIGQVRSLLEATQAELLHKKQAVEDVQHQQEIYATSLLEFLKSILHDEPYMGSMKIITGHLGHCLTTIQTKMSALSATVQDLQPQIAERDDLLLETKQAVVRMIDSLDTIPCLDTSHLDTLEHRSSRHAIGGDLQHCVSLLALHIDRIKADVLLAHQTIKKLRKHTKQLEELGAQHNGDVNTVENRVSQLLSKVQELQQEVSERDSHLSVLVEGDKQQKQLLAMFKEKSALQISELEGKASRNENTSKRKSSSALSEGYSPSRRRISGGHRGGEGASPSGQGNASSFDYNQQIEELKQQVGQLGLQFPGLDGGQD